jgi:hypothetical protein
VAAPQELPRLETWLPYVQRSTPEGRASYDHVRQLDQLAHQAQRDGRIGEAGELWREAERVAVLSLGAAPDALVLQRALHSIDFWSERVAGQVELASHPELAAAHAAVGAERAAAAGLLAEGDTAGAVLLIASAAGTIRDHAPQAVALRVLAAAERRLDPEALKEEATQRALHLLGNARQELVGGDPRRALQRALYALQILEGRELRTIRTGDDTTCVGPIC